MALRGSKRGGDLAVVALLAVLVALLLSVGPVAGTPFPPSAGPTSNAAPLRLSTSSSIPNYPTYLGDLSRNSLLSTSDSSIDVSSAATLHPLWTFESNRTIASQAIVNDGVVYVGSWNGFEYALSASTGKFLWKTYLGVVHTDSGPKECGTALGTTATATYSDGVLYVYAANSRLNALNPTTGSVLWSTSAVQVPAVGYFGWSSPLVYKGNAYVGLASQCDKPLVAAGLAEISLTSHQVIHRFNSSTPYPNGSSIWSSPALNSASNTIFITTGNPYGKLDSTYGEAIISLNATTLAREHVWKVPLAERIGDSDFGATPTLYTPAGYPALVTAANKNGYLYTWYQSNLTLLWQKKMTSSVYVDTTTEAPCCIFGVTPPASVHGKAFASTLFSINPLTGSFQWHIGLPGDAAVTYGAPMWINGVLVVNDGAHLYLVDASNGKVLYESNPGGNMDPPVSAWGSEIFVAHGENLTAYGVGSGAGDSGSAGRMPLAGVSANIVLARVRDS
jgi:outer membrane protein assembly factor BamB